MSIARLEHWSYDHPTNPWLGGGGAYRDWTLLQALSGNWERRFVAAGFVGAQEHSSSWPGTVWIGGGASPGRARLNWIRQIPKHLRRLEENGQLPDLFTASPSILAPTPCLRRHLKRTVLVIHHLVGWNAWRNVGPLAPLCLAYEQGLLRLGHHYVAINKTVEARIRTLNPDARIERIPNGIDATLLSTPRNPSREPLVVFLGRIDIEMKGLDRLLDAFALLRRRIPNVRLEIAGRGGDEDIRHLQALVSAHPDAAAIAVRFGISEAEKAELLSRAWVFASPSRFEGWCIAAVEAQACRVPVVASTADGFLDSVLDTRSGLLVPNREATIRSDLADALAVLLTDPDRRAVMGDDAHAWASAHTWESLARRYEAFLASTLEIVRK